MLLTLPRKCPPVILVKLTLRRGVIFFFFWEVNDDDEAWKILKVEKKGSGKDSACQRHRNM
jgi:hypothetical protein